MPRRSGLRITKRAVDALTVSAMVYIVNATIDTWQRENDVLPESDRTAARELVARDAAAARAS